MVYICIVYIIILCNVNIYLSMLNEEYLRSAH